MNALCNALLSYITIVFLMDHHYLRAAREVHPTGVKATSPHRFRVAQLSL